MVYVGSREYIYRNMLMSHMIADTLDELHGMAHKLGIRNNFQDKPGKPHYDISKAKKQQAIKLGAIEISDKEIVRILRRRY